MANPRFLNKHWHALVKNLEKPNLHVAVKRNSIRLLKEIDIPLKYQGAIMNICFKYLETPGETLAVKVFSMTVLGDLAMLYPAIIPELKLLIEDQLPNQTAGFKSRANKVLKLIS